MPASGVPSPRATPRSRWRPPLSFPMCPDLAELSQDFPRLSNGGRGSRGEELEASGLGARHASGDGGVDHARSGVRQQSCLASVRGTHRGDDDPGLAVALGPGVERGTHDVEQLLAGGHEDEHDVALADIGDAWHTGDAFLGGARSSARCEFDRDDVVAGVHEPSRDGEADRADADDGDARVAGAHHV
jgi:hypothetical protein